MTLIGQNSLLVLHMNVDDFYGNIWGLYNKREFNYAFIKTPIKKVSLLYNPFKVFFNTLSKDKISAEDIIPELLENSRLMLSYTFCNVL